VSLTDRSQQIQTTPADPACNLALIFHHSLAPSGQPMQFNFHIVSQHAPYLWVLPWSSCTHRSSLIARPHTSNGLDINHRRRVHGWNLTLSSSLVSVSRSSCWLPTTLARVPSPRLGFTAETWREGLGERKGVSTSRVSLEETVKDGTAMRQIG
jgi:hypothetical protein